MLEMISHFSWEIPTVADMALLLQIMICPFYTSGSSLTLPRCNSFSSELPRCGLWSCSSHLQVINSHTPGLPFFTALVVVKSVWSYWKWYLKFSGNLSLFGGCFFLFLVSLGFFQICVSVYFVSGFPFLPQFPNWQGLQSDNLTRISILALFCSFPAI